jgi:3-oxoacyl-[acyl-carrier protein] reductase
MKLKDKVALVTGASRGIGKAIAERFAQSGAKVIVHYHNNKKAAGETLSGLSGNGHIVLRADMADPAEVRTLAEKSLEKMGRVDVLVNNAGIYLDHALTEVSYEHWQEAWKKTLHTNLFGPANLTFLIAHQMIKQGGGRIINISSRGAFRGEPDWPAYGASKAGMNSMGQSLAQALAPHKIFIYTIAPGFFETDMAAPFLEGPGGDEIRAQSPLNRAGRPEEIAALSVFLACEQTEYMTGCIIDINGASYLRT